MTMYGNRLIISPHPDDEVLWCSGLLGRDTKVIIVCPNQNMPVTEKARSIIDYEVEVWDYPDLNAQAHQQSIIKDIEALISRKIYTHIFIPSEAAHQDHSAISTACRVALRPKNLYKCNIYEYPYWKLDNFQENFIYPANPNKPEILKNVDIDGWSRYVLEYNNFLSAKYRTKEPMEAFKLLYGRFG